VPNLQFGKAPGFQLPNCKFGTPERDKHFVKIYRFLKLQRKCIRKGKKGGTAVLSVQTASRLFSRNVQLFSVIPAKTGICSVPDETTDSCFRRNDRELEKVAHGVIFPFLYVFHVVLER
jgi:hypothetical protein